MVDLVGLAQARGLERCARCIAKMGLPGVEPAMDPLPRESFDVPTAFALMRRRALDPALVRRLLVWFADRPLELGLVSWDALCSALLDERDRPLLEELRNNALRVRAILPAPGSTFANFQSMSSLQAVESLARGPFRSADDDTLSHAAAELRSLGALDELRSRYGIETLEEGGIIRSTIQFARLFHLSHLSTLATMFADYALHSLRARAALPELVEMFLDVGASGSLPPPSELSPDGTADQLDLLGYAAARTAIGTGEGAGVLAELRSLIKTDYHTAIDDVLRMPRSHVVLADVAAEQNEIVVPFEILDQIAIANPEWRYAHRVRAVVSGLAPQSPGSELALLWVENFLDVFGNDFSHWYESGVVGAGKVWGPKLLARAAAEVAALPHDFMAWAGFASLLDPEGSDLIDEVNARAAAQCDLTPPN